MNNMSFAFKLQYKYVSMLAKQMTEKRSRGANNKYSNSQAAVSSNRLSCGDSAVGAWVRSIDRWYMISIKVMSGAARPSRLYDICSNFIGNLT